MEFVGEFAGVVLVPAGGAAHLAAFNDGHVAKAATYVDMTTPARVGRLGAAGDRPRPRRGQAAGRHRSTSTTRTSSPSTRSSFGYPPEVVAMAERSAAEVLAAVSAGAAPYDGTADAWLGAGRCESVPERDDSCVMRDAPRLSTDDLRQVPQRPRCQGARLPTSSRVRLETSVAGRSSSRAGRTNSKPAVVTISQSRIGARVASSASAQALCSGGAWKALRRDLVRRADEDDGPTQRLRADAADPAQRALGDPTLDQLSEATLRRRVPGERAIHAARRLHRHQPRASECERDHPPSSDRREGRSSSPRRLRSCGGVGGSGWSLLVILLGSESFMMVRSAWPYCR